MRVLKKVSNLNSTDYYETHLSLINCLLPVKMTPKEIKVVAQFMMMKGDITNDLFGSSARKIVKDKLGISSAGLSNYIRELTKKNFINPDKNEIRDILIVHEDSQRYEFTLNNIDNNEDSA